MLQTIRRQHENTAVGPLGQIGDVLPGRGQAIGDHIAVGTQANQSLSTGQPGTAAGTGSVFVEGGTAIEGECGSQQSILRRVADPIATKENGAIGIDHLQGTIGVGHADAITADTDQCQGIGTGSNLCHQVARRIKDDDSTGVGRGPGQTADIDHHIAGIARTGKGGTRQHPTTGRIEGDKAGRSVDLIMEQCTEHRTEVGGIAGRQRCQNTDASAFDQRGDECTGAITELGIDGRVAHSTGNHGGKVADRRRIGDQITGKGNQPWSTRRDQVVQLVVEDHTDGMPLRLTARRQEVGHDGPGVLQRHRRQQRRVVDESKGESDQRHIVFDGHRDDRLLSPHCRRGTDIDAVGGETGKVEQKNGQNGQDRHECLVHLCPLWGSRPLNSGLLQNLDYRMKKAAPQYSNREIRPKWRILANEGGTHSLLLPILLFVSGFRNRQDRRSFHLNRPITRFQGKNWINPRDDANAP